MNNFSSMVFRKVRSMRIVAMIPIKLMNERLPGKNIKCFYDGTPLMHLIQKTLLNVKEISKVYVYCSDENVKKYLLPGVEFLKRPLYLDGREYNCNDILKEFISVIDADIYVASHATGPFTSVGSVQRCIDAVKSEKFDSAFIASKMQQFLWKNGRPLNFELQKFPRTQDLEPVFIETPGAYVFTKEVFQEFGRRVGLNPFICEAAIYEDIDIDNSKDFELADIVYRKIKESGVLI